MLRAVRGLLPARALVVASALAHDPFDLLARELADLRWMRFLPLTDERARLPRQLAPWEYERIDGGVLLSEADVDIEQRPTHPGFDFAGAAQTVLRKQRRLDGLFGSRVSPRQPLAGIVVCEASDRALAVLRGSTAALRTDRPFVVLPLELGAAGSALLALLRAHGYVVFDESLRALPDDTSPASSQRGVDWILALPREASFTRLRQALFARDTVAVDEAKAWNALVEHQLQLESATGGIRFDRRAMARDLALPIDSELLRWGFHPAERSGDTAWCWIGPRPRAGIILPPLATRLERLQLHAASSIDLRNVRELRASIDGEPATLVAHWHGDHGHFELAPAAPDTRWRPFHRLELSMPVSRRPSDEDGRQLALAVGVLTLRAPER